MSVGDEGLCNEETLIPIDTAFRGYPTPEEAAPYFGGMTTAYMHVSVDGTVTVRFSVTTSGLVEDVVVTDSSYDLRGPSRNSYEDGHFDDFLPDLVVHQITGWKYEPIDEACELTRTITFELAADE